MFYMMITAEIRLVVHKPALDSSRPLLNVTIVQVLFYRDSY